jgi:N-acetylglucosamine-6-phosphate deacetylase
LKTGYSPDTFSHQVLPFLGPSGSRRCASDGAESLGAHCEGPFLNPNRNGIHSLAVLQSPVEGFESLSEMYGSENLGSLASPIRLVTLAPELPGSLEAITELRARSIAVSIGHTTASYEQAKDAIWAGATMITHLFNAMNPLHHRNPGIYGLLGIPSTYKPYFGVIVDGIHLHPTSVNIAWHSHPEGCILVTDAMSPAGLPDGIYDWTNGDRIQKKGPVLTLEGSDGKIAGSSITLIECLNNFLNWAKVSIPQALQAVTSTPSKMLGLLGQKGCLNPGADADLVILDENFRAEDGWRQLNIHQVWKFGECIFESTMEEA